MLTAKQLAMAIRQDHGIEMTPDQAHKERRCAYASIRYSLRAKGYTVPDSDEELVELMRLAFGIGGT